MLRAITKSFHFRSQTFFSSAPVPKFPYDTSVDFETNFLENPNAILYDKTQFIAQLIMEENKLLHFNRPRRFGKSLMMEMLHFFYLHGVDPSNSQKYHRNLFIWGQEEDLKKTEIGEKWFNFREIMMKSRIAYVPILLDFSQMTEKKEGIFSTMLKEKILDGIKIVADHYRIQNNEKSKHIALLLDEIFNKHQSNNSLFSTVSSVFSDLRVKSFQNFKVVFLIDEYENPIVGTLGKPEYAGLLKELTECYNTFFQQLKSYSRNQKFFEKATMTGVLSLRNLSIFSGMNSFLDLTFEEEYATAFGITKKDLLTNEQSFAALRTMLIKHKCLEDSSKELQTAEKKEKENEEIQKYVDALIQAYNGFHFSYKNLEHSVISPISLIRHMNNLLRSKQIENPYRFDCHWSKTGSTQLIGNLVSKDQDPYQFPELIESLRQKKTSTSLLTAAHDYQKHNNIPIDVVMFDTGYFTIKEFDKNMTVQLDWTNEEAREAFYSIYIQEIKMDDAFLTELLNGEHQDENQRERKLASFVKVLQQYFRKVLEKYYLAPNGKIRSDSEGNQTHFLFKNLIANVSSSRFELLDRVRLLEPQEKKNQGYLPDIILYSKEQGEVLILEFLKNS